MTCISAGDYVPAWPPDCTISSQARMNNTDAAEWFGLRLNGVLMCCWWAMADPNYTGRCSVSCCCNTSHCASSVTMATLRRMRITGQTKAALNCSTRAHVGKLCPGFNDNHRSRVSNQPSDGHMTPAAGPCRPLRLYIEQHRAQSIKLWHSAASLARSIRPHTASTPTPLPYCTRSNLTS